MIGTGPIESHPQLITLAAAGGTNVRVRIVAVNAPGREDALGKAIFTRTADVIHDFVTAILDDGFANSSGNVVKRGVPSRLFPLACAPFAGALEWVKNA